MSTNEFKFFKELSSIPLINFSFQTGSNVYHNLKKCHQYVETTLSTTEDLVWLIANASTVQRITQSLEKPLCYVDGLASDGLQLLEQKYPSMLISPEDLKDETLNQMVVLRDASSKRLEDLVREICRKRRQGVGFALNYFEAKYGPKVSVYVDLIERSLNEYLPPVETKGTEIVMSPRQDQRVLARLAYIPQTVQQRLVQRYRQYVVRVTFVDDGNNDSEDKTIKKESEGKNSKEKKLEDGSEIKTIKESEPEKVELNVGGGPSVQQ